MDVEGEKIYPDPEASGIEYDPDDWELGRGPYARHAPTGTIWHVGLDEGAVVEGQASICNFYGQLVHYCDHRYDADNGLDDETMTFLGRGAIAVFLRAIGAWKPVVTVFADRPEHKRMRKSWPKPGR